jgi:hypothetical protein
MAVTLYGNYIDYNGDSTFIAVNTAGGVINDGEGNIQCHSYPYLADDGQTVRLQVDYYQYNCNCACFQPNCG